MSERNSIIETAVTFVVGAAAGYLIGVLFAPASGKKTRHNIQKEIDKAGDMVKDGYEKVAKEAGKGIEAIKSHI